MPKYIPLKTAAIKKEFMGDFTAEELEQFKSDLKPENQIKKVYRVEKSDDSKLLDNENIGFEMPQIDNSLFPDTSKIIKDEKTYLNYPSKAPEQ